MKDLLGVCAIRLTTVTQRLDVVCQNKPSTSAYNLTDQEVWFRSTSLSLPNFDKGKRPFPLVSRSAE